MFITSLAVSAALVWPLPPGTTVVMEAPEHAWGIRPVANQISDKVDGLEILSDRGISCSDYPDAACIQVKKRLINPDYVGEYWPNEAGQRQIRFNTYYQWFYDYSGRQSTACHELLHALGFDHHSGHGCVGNYTERRPNLNEYIVLQDWYSE